MFGLRKNKWILSIFALFFACLLCTSCGKTEKEDLSEEVKAFNASIKKSSVDTEGNSGLVIGSVNMGMNGEWFSEVMNGIRGAGKDLGVEVKMLDSEYDVQKEAAHIDELVKEKVDAIVISPIDVNITAQSLQKAKDAGIPIITWNTTVNTDIDAAVGVVPADLGAGAGNYACEYIKTHGLKDVKMFILGYTKYEIGVGRCNGFKSAIQDMVDQGVIDVVSDVSDGGETLDEGLECTNRILKEHPEINMIWAWNQGVLHGAAQALKDAGRKDIVLLGVDMSMQLANDMLEDKIDLEAVTTQLPYNMGYKAVVNAVEVAKGNQIDKQIWIPVSTYIKSDEERLKQYIENHKDLVEE